MASAATENTPLIPALSNPQSPLAQPRPQRTVTFNPTISTSSPPPRNTIRTAVPPSAQASSYSSSVQHAESKFSALNNKLRRRNSQPATLTPLTTQHASKIGPQRTTKVTQKLKLLPDPEHGDEGPDEESGRDVYAQYTR